jgi:hypothetical protein
MTPRRTLAFLLIGCALAICSPGTFAQSQTTGRIAGTVRDQTGAVIARAEVTVVSRAIGDERRTTSDETGNYAVSLLPPGTYQVNITASGFKKVVFDNVTVAITEITQINADLEVGSVIESVTIRDVPALTQTDGPRLGRVVDSRAVSELPLATRNFTQILGLSPGADVGLADNTGVGPQLAKHLSQRRAQDTKQLPDQRRGCQIDNASGRDEFDSSAILGNQLDNRANRGVSDFDRTHRFVLSYLWDLPQPAFAGNSKAARLLLSNWEVASIVVAMSGQPIDIVDTGAGSFYGLNGGNVLRGPRQSNVDFSLIKRFPFGESKNIEFHAEFFNLFNHVNLANPISDFNAIVSTGGSIDPDTGRIINPGDFGRITSASNNPRLIQFVLKFNF